MISLSNAQSDRPYNPNYEYALSSLCEPSTLLLSMTLHMDMRYNQISTLDHLTRHTKAIFNETLRLALPIIIARVTENTRGGECQLYAYMI